MDSFWVWPLVLAVLLFAWPALKDVAARIALTRYRSSALASQPDAISLVRVREPRWRNPQAFAASDRELAAAGFAEAGAYVVHEMPGLTLGLYALPGERAYAVVYDHPRSGSWAEIVTRYEDGSLACFTTLEPMDVELPEGALHVAVPGAPLGELWKRMRAERPARPMRPCSRAEAARDFERAYADSMALHRGRSGAGEPGAGELGRAA
jgi:hypothetical protein